MNPRLKLYLLSQTENNDWDTYDSAVVCAESVDEARVMSPHDGKQITEWAEETFWCNKPECVKVEYIGDALDGMAKGVVCASYNAG